MDAVRAAGLAAMILRCHPLEIWLSMGMDVMDRIASGDHPAAHRYRSRIVAEENRILVAALLWARNHLECMTDQTTRDKVIETLDRVISHREPTVADMQAFRDMYTK
jgi:hypothetical protein